MPTPVKGVEAEHRFRLELDGPWFVAHCSCGWNGHYEAYRGHARAEWSEHVQLQKETTDKERGHCAE